MLDRFYPFFLKFLFFLNPECAHAFVFAVLDFLEKINVLKYLVNERIHAPVQLMGITFPNRIGLAAGLDKNGDHLASLSRLGFGFIEVGTVTPLPQEGNPKPRLFRLTQNKALINRMGFNNKGVDHLVNNLKRKRAQENAYALKPINYVLGVNIGKNKNTPSENAYQDYCHCLQKVYPYADYITINISSPNTAGLREQQHRDKLNFLLKKLMAVKNKCYNQYHRSVPLLIKVAPDLGSADIESIAECVLSWKIDGLIVSNTTIDRSMLEGCQYAEEQGGLSGEPLAPLANTTLAGFAAILKGRVLLMGVGGIHDVKTLQEKYDRGADLAQIYTALIYQGPTLIHQLARVVAPSSSS